MRVEPRHFTQHLFSFLAAATVCSPILGPVTVAARADQTPAAAADPVASVLASLPRIRYRKRILPNGLTFYAVENHATPTVAIQVWYKVGSKDDPPERSGFAHLFEHMMFKATKNMKAEMMDRLTEDVGGENNAYTADDVTVFHETVPSNYLETLLWAEADRMANLDVDDKNFHSERAVVEEEYRQSVEAPPYGRLENLVPQLSYTVHPYRRPTIGSLHDLDQATIADVRRFHDTFYRPDNAVLIVAGDFDPSHLDAWVDRYFGRIPKPDTAIPRVTAIEPPRTEAKRFDRTAPGVPLPAINLTYLVPGIADSDAPALRVADVILSGGESSRLYHALVYEQQIASDANSSADLEADSGLFILSGTAASGKTLDQIQTALLAEVERLQTTAPPTTEEMTKARNQLITGALHSRETVDGTAASLGNAVVMQGDGERVNTDIQKLAAVTAEDVQRVLKKYVTDTNRVEIRYSAAPAAATTTKGSAAK